MKKLLLVLLLFTGCATGIQRSGRHEDVTSEAREFCPKIGNESKDLNTLTPEDSKALQCLRDFVFIYCVELNKDNEQCDYYREAIGRYIQLQH